MPSQVARVNVALPAGLVAELADAVGPRGKSVFIAEAVRDCLERREKRSLNAELQGGYAARRDEGAQLTQVFEAVDLKGWGDHNAPW
ncbi:hypothetical protein [Solidesulfovibrio sp.]|uniref:hypothetical protein n=1 Tax=Solidesulfovibrio sp. TaxID=2910990 RepID=UPI002636F4EB|nr:hypothetical protein [Solidesulfovibrio sp.]